MRIGLDLRMLDGGSGISRYISELSREILKQDKANQYVLFFNNLTEQLKKEYEGYGHELVETKIPHYSYAEQSKLPFLLLNKKLDLVHFPHFNVPLMYRKPYIVTIHDLTHTLFPGRNKFRSYKRIAYNLVIWNAVNTAKKIIAVSESTKKQVVEHFGLHGSKIVTVYEGVNPNFKMINKDDSFRHVSNRFGISKPYILFVGVWRRYKNVETLSLAFDKLKNQGLDYQLVLAGEPDPFYPDIREKVMNIKHQQDLKAVGRVSDDDLSYLYNGADLFVLPSIAEGFGLPPLEAAACGIPVACSDIPVLREVMGNGAEYFDPKNLNNMTEVIASVLTNPKKSHDLANLALARTKHFSWQKAGSETINIYQSIK